MLIKTFIFLLLLFQVLVIESISIENHQINLDNIQVKHEQQSPQNNILSNIFKKSKDNLEEQDLQISTVMGLVERKLGKKYLKSFQFNIQIDSEHREYFKISSNGDCNSNNQSPNGSNTVITITGNSGVNIASGFYYYLKYYCYCSFTWTGDQCKFSENLQQKQKQQQQDLDLFNSDSTSSGSNNNNNNNDLPQVPESIEIIIPSQYRYYMNVCTFGYTTVWWNWTNWEKEIDWMALNGYNLPLAFNGQEYIWYEVYKELGLSESDILAWLTGPAFLPWNRMGNVNGWGGLITKEWLHQQRDLQIQILTRMRSYGMQAVLPGFAGHVPQGLSSVYPKANVTQLGAWGNFSGTYFLESSDPLFIKITELFISTQNKIYGTDHFYNFDPFNEVDPPLNTTDYLRNTSMSMYNNLIQADPNAIWVLQGWFIVDDQEFWQQNQTEAFLSGVPLGNLIVLDLWADVVPGWSITQNFYGHYWIWCMLHNFGGRTGMYGRLPYISTQPIIARNQSSHMIGTGLTPEAIDQNVMVYDLMSEMSWRSTPPNLTDWITDYTQRRYGKLNPQLIEIWQTLSVTLFNATANDSMSNMGAPFSFIAYRPEMTLANNLWYDPSVVVQIWSLYTQVNDSYILSSESYQFDLTEITIQVLSNYFLEEYQSLVLAFNASNLDEFQSISVRMLSIIDYVELIAASQKMNLLGVWTYNARQWSPNNYSLYEFNARNQLTLWGPPFSNLHDYAYKLWSGLIGDFYYTRWMIFFKYSTTCLQDSIPFNVTYVQETIVFFEETWNEFLNIYPYEPTGSSLKIAKLIQSQIQIPTSSSGSNVETTDEDIHFDDQNNNVEIYNRQEQNDLNSDNNNISILII